MQSSAIASLTSNSHSGLKCPWLEFLKCLLTSGRRVFYSNPFATSSSRLTFDVGNSWAKVGVEMNVCTARTDKHPTGYKVGRVDQAETALGAEMRLAADKGKKASGKSGGDKIVKRFAPVKRPPFQSR